MEFHSPTYGKMRLVEVVGRIEQFVGQVESGVKITVGTDSSTPTRGQAEFVTAVVVHKIGRGGIYFWRRTVDQVVTLRDRIYKEALLSIEIAQRLIEDDRILDLPAHLEIHVDVGQSGESHSLIKEVVGMVTGNGFTAKTKPEAYAASHVADRHT